MSSAPSPRRASDAHLATPREALRALRRRLVRSFAIVAIVSIAAFAATIVVVDHTARQRELDQRLLGLASRASALVYTVGDEVRTDAVEDDAVREQSALLAVYRGTTAADLTAVFSSPDADPPGDLTPLADRAVSDREERGSFLTVGQGAATLRAVSLPWYDGSRVGGAVVVAAAPVSILGSGVLLPAIVGGVALAVLLTLVTAALVRRGLRPAEESLDERDRFLAMAAHELRTPIARIRAGAEALERTIRPGTEQAAALRRLAGIADGAGRVVGDLLLAARIDQGTVLLREQDVRLDEIATESEHLHPAVVVDVTEPVVVRGDPDLLRHAVGNLVENALRHGRVPDRPLLVTVRVAREGDAGAVLSVADNGAGIAADLDAVAPFVSTSTAGSGLGLALVSWIASRQDAELRMSRGEPGTIAEIRFRAAM